MISLRVHCAAIFVLLAAGERLGAQQADPASPVAATEASFEHEIRPLLKAYCLNCHSQEAKKGSLDLERFVSLDRVRQDLKPWQGLIEMLDAGEMPPKDKPQPTADERRRLVAWTRAFLEGEIRARAGDPGYVPLRRLNNAEYNNTIRDLTGVDLRPAREFPADGAAGEGFANAAEALGDISPTLLNKYLNAAKELAEHAVLLPDGFRFSPATTRQDWIDESLVRLRSFYTQYTADGQLPLETYLAALARHRQALLARQATPAQVAVREQLHPKYLEILWQTITDTRASFPLDLVRHRWFAATQSPNTATESPNTATESPNTAAADVAGIVAEIKAWQEPLWTTARIGSYKGGDTRKQPNDPPSVPTQRLTYSVKPAPGQREVVLYLAANNLLGTSGQVIWQQPRLEKAHSPPLLLRDYASFGPQHEIDYGAIFAAVPDYMALAVEAAQERNPSAAARSIEEMAAARGLNPDFAKRWLNLLALQPPGAADAPPAPTPAPRGVGLASLELLSDKNPLDDQRPWVAGWKRQGASLPMVLANGSGKTEIYAGGTGLEPHSVSLFATATEFAGALWTSPLAGSVRLDARISLATIIRGNGAHWWLEHRRGRRAAVLAAGTLDAGQVAQVPAITLQVEPGDIVVLAVGARVDKPRSDPTEIHLTVTETAEPARVWDLTQDLSDSLSAGNPHADSLGNPKVWSFAQGSAVIPAGSILAHWHAAASDPAQAEKLAALATKVGELLAGTQPSQEKDPNRRLYDNLVAVDGPLLAGLDLAGLSQARTDQVRYGLDPQRFGFQPSRTPADTAAVQTSVRTEPDEVIELRLPAGLFREYEFVVDGTLDPPDSDRVVQFRLLTSPPAKQAGWDGKSPLVAAPGSANFQRLVAGFAEFRRVFPPYVCFPAIVPTDEVVSLKLFHREDEPLIRLLLDDAGRRQIDRLWEEHRFISRFPVTEYQNLPLFIGFVTQDRPKSDQLYFEGLREPFRQRAEAFEREIEAAVPRQLDALVDFAERAFRRPLSNAERAEIRQLYATLRAKDIPHDEAFRSLLARVLVSPSFLFRLEQAPPGSQPAEVGDFELAARLSYFLWSSLPDDELRGLAAAGRLHDPQVLAEQTRRMLADERVRALAIEFGTQWIHVRGFDELREKNETLFPMFNDELRGAIYEETIRFFQDLFQADQPVAHLLDADDTFLNETLARHYGIPGVTGPEWRRVSGVKKYGRGGLLGLASVQARQSGASRTSPVLRGNWVVETLLGEKLPPPPANVPRLPEAETGNDGLTMRQLVEKHVQVAECAVCHQRIDPFGFALEHYDPIGRLRDKDAGGLPLDAQARLRDGTQFEGIEGLRGYLLTHKCDVFVRLFCRRLLGYALGRGVTLSDQPLLDTMVARLNAAHGRTTAAVLAIVESPQFRRIRGNDYVAAE